MHTGKTKGALLEYEDDTGNVYQADVLRAEVVHHLFEQDRARVRLDWADWIPIRVALKSSNTVFRKFRLYMDGALAHSGRLSNVDERQSYTRVEFDIGSWEEDAREEPPSGPQEKFLSTNDDVIAKDIIGRIGTVDEGTIEQVAGSVTMVFNRQSPAGMLRQLARETGAEIRYNADQTVDYVSTLGTDKRGIDDQRLMANDNIEAAHVKTDERMDVTHILVLGAGEGHAQVSALVVSDDFGGPPERDIYMKHVDKRLKYDSSAKRMGQDLMAEVDSVERHLEVEVTGVEVEPIPRVGDWYDVVDAINGVNHDLRVTEVRWMKAANKDRVTLRGTNMPLMSRQKHNLQRRQDVDAGSGIRGSTASYLNTPVPLQPVSGTHNATGYYRYPGDVVKEVDAKAIVELQEYRYRDGTGITTTGDYPTNVKVLVDRDDNGVHDQIGDTIAGGSKTRKVIDFSVAGPAGLPDNDIWNEVRVESDTLGLVQVSLWFDFYRRAEP